MDALLQVAAKVVADIEWLLHVVGSISEILWLTFSNCPFDRLGALILPWTGLPVAFLYKRFFVVGVGVNEWDGSWLEVVNALKFTFVKASGKNIDFSEIRKLLQICATSIGFAFLQKKAGCVVNGTTAECDVSKQAISQICLYICRRYVKINRILFSK